LRAQNPKYFTTGRKSAVKCGFSVSEFLLKEEISTTNATLSDQLES